MHQDDEGVIELLGPQLTDIVLESCQGRRRAEERKDLVNLFRRSVRPSSGRRWKGLTR